MWFTDFGKTRPHDADRTGVFYATVDGKFSKRSIFPLLGPNGIGLSPDDSTLYVSETPTGRPLGRGIFPPPAGSITAANVVWPTHLATSIPWEWKPTGRWW